MRKKLPNILLLLVILVNLFFMGNYIRNHSWGLFFSTTGIVFLILGVMIFIFFLSIDPGYGWIRSINLTKNYIMIFTSMAVSIAGVVLIITGQHLNELHVQSLTKAKRCQDLIAGKAPEVLRQAWYSLQDQKSKGQLRLYLFQKKSNRNNYKIIATFQNSHLPQVYTIKKLTVSTDVTQKHIHASAVDSTCPGIYEKNISIDFDKHLQLRGEITFNLAVTVSEDVVSETVRNDKEKTIQFTLHSTNSELEEEREPTTHIGTQSMGNDLIGERS